MVVPMGSSLWRLRPRRLRILYHQDNIANWCVVFCPPLWNGFIFLTAPFYRYATPIRPHRGGGGRQGTSGGRARLSGYSTIKTILPIGEYFFVLFCETFFIFLTTQFYGSATPARPDRRGGGGKGRGGEYWKATLAVRAEIHLEVRPT